MKQVLLLISLLAWLHPLSAQELRTVNIKGEPYYVYPYRVTEQKLDIPPYLGTLPDGKYVLLYDYYYEKKFSIRKMKKVEKASDSTRVAALFELRNNQKDGEAFYFFKNTKKQVLEAKGWYKNGLREGMFVLYTIYGKKHYKSAETPFKNGRIDGLVKKYEDGKLLKETFYQEGLALYDLRGYSKNGRLSFVQTVYDSIITIPSKYSIDAFTQLSRIVKYPKLAKNSIAYVFHNNGELFAKITVDSSGKHWCDTIYDINGTPNTILQTGFDNKGNQITHVEAVSSEREIRKFLNDTLIRKDYYNLKTGEKTRWVHLYSNEEIQKMKPDSIITIARYHKQEIQLLPKGPYLLYQNTGFSNPEKTEIIRSINDSTLLVKKTSLYNGDSNLEVIAFYLLSRNDRIDNPYKSKSFSIYQYIQSYSSAYYREIEDSIPEIRFKGRPINGLVKMLPKKKNQAKEAVYKNGIYFIYGVHPYYLTEGRMKNGRWHGKVVTRSKSGATALEEEFDNGVLHGEYKRYRTQRISEIKKLDPYCELKGKTHTYLAEVIHYNHGKKEGDYVKMSPHGNILYFCTYHNNEIHGLAEGFLHNGERYYHGRFVNGKKQGLHTYRVFNVVSEMTPPLWKEQVLTINYNDGTPHGGFDWKIDRRSYVSGKMLNGYPDGEWLFFYSDDLNSKGLYLAEKRIYNVKDSVLNCDIQYTIRHFNDYSGEVFERYDKRTYTINRSFNYRTHTSGTCTIELFRKNGGLVAKGTYTKNYLSDSLYIFDENNILISKAFLFISDSVFKSDFFVREQMPELVGKCKKYRGYAVLYSANGLPRLEGPIEKLDVDTDCDNKFRLPGFILYPWKSWDPTGKLIFEKEGYFRSFSRTGHLESEGKFENGNRDGVWKKYNSEGGLVEIGEYVNGQKHGKWYEGDLSGIHIPDGTCFDLSDPRIEEYLSVLKKEIRLTEAYYENGKFIYSSSFQINQNKKTKSDFYGNRRINDDDY